MRFFEKADAIFNSPSCREQGNYAHNFGLRAKPALSILDITTSVRSTTVNSTSANTQGPQQKTLPQTWQGRWWPVAQVVVTLAVVGAVMVILIWKPFRSSTQASAAPEVPKSAWLTGPRSIEVSPNTPLAGKLQTETIESRWLTAPVLTAVGTAMVKLRPGKEDAAPVSGATLVLAGAAGNPAELAALTRVLAAIAAAETKDAWQFATADLLNAFADWEKAGRDLELQEPKLQAIRARNEANIAWQRSVVARKEKLVQIGTNSQEELDLERNNLIQVENSGRNEIRDAEAAVDVARQTRANTARLLQQAGLEPTMLRSAAAEGVIMVAEVPERDAGRVKIGMTCKVRFYGFEGREFTGKVSSTSPVIAKDRRVLSAQFIVKDPHNEIIPGRWADIEVGTDGRQALLMPANGLLHVGENDYALLATDEPGSWRITRVQTGASGVWFGLSQSSFDKLKKNDAPESMLGQLEPLIGKRFVTEETFLDALKSPA